MSTAPALRYRRRATALDTDLGEDIALLDMAGGSYFGLNRTAAEVWRLLAQPRDVEALCAELTARFDVEPGRCRAAVEGLLARLDAAGLIEPADPSE